MAPGRAREETSGLFTDILQDTCPIQQDNTEQAVVVAHGIGTLLDYQLAPPFTFKQ
jgi:hypothetical protein